MVIPNRKPDCIIDCHEYWFSESIRLYIPTSRESREVENLYPFYIDESYVCS